MIPALRYGAIGLVALSHLALGTCAYRAGSSHGASKVEAKWHAEQKEVAQELAARAARIRDLQDWLDTERTEGRKAYEEELASIGADRDSLFGRVQVLSTAVARAEARAATDRLGIDVATGIARSAEEASRAVATAFDAYDVACRRDAVRLSGLQDSVAKFQVAQSKE